MKKLFLLSLLGLLAAVSVPAVADINNSSIWILNNTDKPIEVSEQRQWETLFGKDEDLIKWVNKHHGDQEYKQSFGLPIAQQTEKSVGAALTVKKGDYKKIVVLGRDQNIRKVITPLGLAIGWIPISGLFVAELMGQATVIARSIKFTTSYGEHVFTSTGYQFNIASTLTYNKSMLPITLNGLQVRPIPYNLFNATTWGLYRPVVMEFNPKFKELL
jgi:hypothetical protein